MKYDNLHGLCHAAKSMMIGKSWDELIAAPAVKSHLGWLFAHDPLESLNVGS